MRRRLAWIGGSLAIVALVIAVGVMWPSTASDPPQEFSARRRTSTRSPSRLSSRVDRAKALATAANFVTYAVARRGRALLRPDGAGAEGRALESGVEHAGHPRGAVPGRGGSVEDRVLLQRRARAPGHALPDRCFEAPPVHVRDGADADRHGKNKWLVSSWAPVGMTGANAAAAAPAASRAGRAAYRIWVTALPQGEARLDAKWLLAPLGLLLLVPLIVSGYYVRGWRRGRRAEALYGSRRARLRSRFRTRRGLARTPGRADAPSAGA